MQSRHRVVVIGGGFGGLYAVQALRSAPVDVTLVDRRNHHLFQPLLYQVATGGLSPANIASPLRYILRRQKNANVLLDEARGLDAKNRTVRLIARDLPYDSLIVAAGATNNYFGNDAWEMHAPGLKSIEEATDIRRRVLSAFEEAERESDPQRVRALLTFVVIGAGATGVELAGAIAELARHTLRRDFRTIDPTHARILLIDMADRVLPTYPPVLSYKAQAALEQLGASVRTGVKVTFIAPERVEIENEQGAAETIPAHTTLWAAGVAASGMGRAVSAATGAQTDRSGRVVVHPDLTLPDHPEIFVIGDLAWCDDGSGRALPGIAPVAMQQGRYVARLIRARLRRKSLPPFAYKHRGSMATIGRAAAVADLGWVYFSGRLAWLAWLFVHLIYLVEFQNRLLVLVQWAWNYLTWNRSARLITGAEPPSLDRNR